ncbi:hypothetical protein D6779_02820, partial [Candidatus Parcubacteria bacterium]
TTLDNLRVWVGDILLPSEERPIPIFIDNNRSPMVTTEDASHISNVPVSLFNSAGSTTVITDAEIEISKALQSRYATSVVYRSSLDDLKGACLVPVDMLPNVCSSVRGMARTINFIAMVKCGIFAENTPPKYPIEFIGTSSLIEILSDVLNVDPQTVSNAINTDDIQRGRGSACHGSVEDDNYTIQSAAEIALKLFSRH